MKSSGERSGKHARRDRRPNPTTCRRSPPPSPHIPRLIPLPIASPPRTVATTVTTAWASRQVMTLHLCAMALMALLRTTVIRRNLHPCPILGLIPIISPPLGQLPNWGVIAVQSLASILIPVKRSTVMQRGPKTSHKRRPPAVSYILQPISSSLTSLIGSPTLTSPDMYVNRSFIDEQKTPLNHLETTPYLFPGSRSISPTTSTPPSSSTTSLTSPFQFTFPPEGSIGQERPEFDYRRHSSAHGAEVTLHGGTADISLSGAGSDGVRYRIGPRRANSGPERPLLPAIPHFSGSDNGSQHERGSSEGESTSYSQLPKLRPRRGLDRESRSPSPGGPPISGTLAVIKAQAFGALRRTRTRTKKSSEGAAKVAMEVLEARGIGMGVATSSKRPRLHNDDPDME